MICPICQKSLPDDAKYCYACGQEVDPLKARAMPNTVVEPEVTEMMLFGLGIMALMFGLMLILPAAVASDFIPWTVPAIVTGIGVVLLTVRHFLIKSHVKQVEKKIEQIEAKVRCKYCGSLNEQKTQKCIGCGAPMY